MKSDRVPGGLPRRSIRPPARAGGQSLVEFGLIALTLVFLIGAGVDLALMVTVRQTVSVITGEAARQVAYGAPVID
ncbi:MAG: TadE/TadG family type IV pilus assembly protein, partial [Chloroflexota bacterium]